jgi:maltooligosyltrehalose trehalohydrolase
MTVGVGAVPEGTGGTRFTVWAPRARSVDVLLVTSGERVGLDGSADGYYTGVAPCGPGARYRYVLDGASEFADPASRLQPDGVHGPSEVVDVAAHEWGDDGYRAVPLRDAVLYELHIGTFTAGGTFASAVAELDDLVQLGVTTVEIMPVAQFPGSRNWGYDGVFPYAVQDTYGGPTGLQFFVEECHRRGLGVVLDVVYNHLGPEGNVLPAYGPYLTDRYRTPWGPAVNLDGPSSDPVRGYFVANAIGWLNDFHVDALRLDAVHELVDRSARPFLAELAGAVSQLSEHSGRPHWLIAESADNDPRVVTPGPAGGLGLDAQWNDDFHHAVHAALTGERDGYFGDFGRVDDIARAMSQGFVYQGQFSGFRRRRHGAPSTALPPERFVIFDQNHDQVGNRPDGARLASLVPAPRRRLAAALLLLSPGIPLLFMGEEYGETAPFPYFVDHGDPKLIDAVRRGRATDHLPVPGEVADPADPETFTRATLDRTSTRRQGEHRDHWLLYGSLLSLRAAEPALRRSTRECTRAHADGPVVTLVRTHRDVTIAVLFNLSGSETDAHLPEGDCWTEMLPYDPAPASSVVPLAPWGFRVFRCGPQSGGTTLA